MMGFNNTQKEIFQKIKEIWSQLHTIINTIEESNIKDIILVILKYGSNCDSIKDLSIIEQSLEDIYPFVSRLPEPQHILNIMQRIQNLKDRFMEAFFSREYEDDLL